MNEVKCPYCDELVSSNARKCKHCGEFLDAELRQLRQPRQQLWHPGVAAVLSLIVPGAGQMYKGQVGGGICLLIFTAIGYMAAILPGVVLHVFCILSAATGDPTKSTGDSTKSRRRESEGSRSGCLVTLVIIFISIGLFYLALWVYATNQNSFFMLF